MPMPTTMMTSSTVPAPTAALARKSMRTRSRPIEMSIAREMALSEVTSRPHLKFEVRVTGDMAFSGFSEGFVLWVENRLMFDGGCEGEIKIPALNAASDAAFRNGVPGSQLPLLCRGFRYGGRGGRFGRDFGRGDWTDLHGREDLFQAAEDFVAVDVLDDAVFRGDGGDVQGELVAGSILVDMEVLRVALASSLSGHGFGGPKFEVSDQQLRTLRLRLRGRGGRV